MKLQDYVTGVQHLGIPSADLAKTTEFYTGLGFEITFQHTDPQSGNTWIFYQLKNIVVEAYTRANPARIPGAIDHLSIDVTDADAAYAAAVAAGYKILGSEVRQLPFFEKGVRLFMIEGPNGEKLEFNQIL